MSIPSNPRARVASRARQILVPALFLSLVSTVAVAATTTRAAESWPTKGHDNRRTAQINVSGPATVKSVATTRIDQGGAINVAATVASDGTTFFGTWGTVQDNGKTDRSDWDKLSGDVLAVRPSFGTTATLASSFAPSTLDPVPYCYDYNPSGASPTQCGGSLSEELTMWTGTVEGTPVLSPDQKVLYLGRGDGKVYALDTKTGQMLWDFHTCNDVNDCGRTPSNPEFGGEVVAGLLLRGGTELYLGSFAVEGSNGIESTALYKLDAASGALVWRYPGSGSLPGVFMAAPALSPDGNTIYAATMCAPAANCTAPGYLYAFDPNGTLRWNPIPLYDGKNRPAGAWSMAVGTDGTVFVGGGGSSACDSAYLTAFEPKQGARRWGPVALPSGFGIPCANRTGGLALREVSGKTTRVYASTNFSAEMSPIGQPTGGRVFAFDPATGKQSWGSPFFDPSRAGGFGNALYPSIDKDGTIYTGSSGSYVSGSPAYPVQRGARIFAVTEKGAVKWSYDAQGVIAYAHPVLGGDGALRFGDMRARNVDPWLRPANDPIYAGVDQSPAFYAISGK